MTLGSRSRGRALGSRPIAECPMVFDRLAASFIMSSSRSRQRNRKENAGSRVWRLSGSSRRLKSRLPRFHLMIARRLETRPEPAGRPLHSSIRHSPDDASLDRLAHEHELGGRFLRVVLDQPASSAELPIRNGPSLDRATPKGCRPSLGGPWVGWQRTVSDPVRLGASDTKV
jgi:hypothetical protein